VGISLPAFAPVPKDHLWVYVLAPFCAAPVAAGVFALLRGAAEKKADDEFDELRPTVEMTADPERTAPIKEHIARR